MIHTEKYIFTSPSRYWRGAPHTDTVVEVDNTPPFHEKLFDEVMNEEDYNNTILANSSISFSDIFEKNDKVRVVVYSRDIYNSRNVK